MIVRPALGNSQKVEVSRPTDGMLYFYRLASLHNSIDEVLLCANRTGGLGACNVVSAGSRRVVQQFWHEGLDIVDVCGIPDGSMSGVAVSREGCVVWVKDARHIARPLVFRPPYTDGIVYRVLATPRHLCVLTSRALYVWIDLIRAFNEGRLSTVPAMRAVFNVSAADITLIGDELLVVTGGNEVESVSLESLTEAARRTVFDQHDPDMREDRMEELAVEYIDQEWEPRELQCEGLVTVAS